MKSTVHRLILAVLISTAGWAADLFELPPPAEETIDFERDIAPIIGRSCLPCHGLEKVESNYRIDSRESAIKGGVNGAAIVPGDSENSLLTLLIAGAPGYIPMPNEGERLTAAEVGLMRAWIDQGVPWRDPEAGVTTFSHKALAGDWRTAVVGAGGHAADWSAEEVAGALVLKTGEAASLDEGMAQLIWRVDPRPVGAAFTVPLKGEGDGPCGGVMFRFVDAYNYLVVRYDPGKGQLAIGRVAWGIYSDLFRSAVAVPDDGWLGLSVSDLGGAVTVKAGDKVVFDRVIRSMGRETGEAVGVWVPAGRQTAFRIQDGG